MPEIDAFLGLSFCMYYFDNQRHQLPHIHVRYAEYELVLAINTGECLEGYLPSKQRKYAEIHIETHKEKLLLMWEKAIKGQYLGKLGDVC